MQRIDLAISGYDVSQEQAQQMARLLAAADNPDCFIVSRYNRRLKACSPCCLKNELGDKPGWEVYGEHHGGRLRISINNDDYVFIMS